MTARKPRKLWTLPADTDTRLSQAGLRDDPALQRIRDWNAAAYARGSIRVETRRGQFGKTRLIKLEPGQPEQEP